MLIRVDGGFNKKLISIEETLDKIKTKNDVNKYLSIVHHQSARLDLSERVMFILLNLDSVVD